MGGGDGEGGEDDETSGPPVAYFWVVELEEVVEGEKVVMVMD